MSKTKREIEKERKEIKRKVQCEIEFKAEEDSDIRERERECSDFAWTHAGWAVLNEGLAGIKRYHKLTMSALTLPSGP